MWITKKMDLPLIKKRIAAIIRTEIKEVEQRYLSMCERIDIIVDNDLKIPREDVAQRKWDLKKIILEDIHQPQKDELQKFLNIINRFKDSNKKIIFPKETQREFDRIWDWMFLDYEKRKWNNSDYGAWKKHWHNLIKKIINSELN